MNKLKFKFLGSIKESKKKLRMHTAGVNKKQLSNFVHPRQLHICLSLPFGEWECLGGVGGGLPYIRYIDMCRCEG